MLLAGWASSGNRMKTLTGQINHFHTSEDEPLVHLIARLNGILVDYGVALDCHIRQRAIYGKPHVLVSAVLIPVDGKS